MYNEDNELFGGAHQKAGSDPLSDVTGGGDFWVTDTIEGLGLGVLGAAEGILELGNLIPGIDYDIPDNFGAGHAETAAGQFAEGMMTFMAPFFVPGAGWVGAGAKLGRGAKAVSLVKESGRIASAARKVEGGAFKLGKYIAGDKMGLNKRIAPWRQKHLDEKARLWQEGVGYRGQTPAAMAAAGKAAMIGKIPEIAGATLGGAMVDFSVWDPQEARLSNMVQAIPGLENPVSEFLQYEEGDSKLEGRIKQTLEGAGMGLFVDGFLTGLKGLNSARRVFKSTGDSVKAQRAYTQEVIENNIARYQQEFNVSREDAIISMTMDLGIDPHAIHWGATTEEAEKIFFQVERDAVPETLKDVLSPDDLRKLNTTAMKEVERLVNTQLEGALDPVVLKNMAVAGESVRGEYERMGTKILPELFPAQKNLGRTQHDGRLWTCLNAMLSANQEVTVHTGAAMMMLSAWRAAGRPTDKRIIRRLLTDSLKDTGHLTKGMEKKKAAKSLKGMRAQHKNIATLLADADKLTASEMLDRVNTELIKTREFAGAYPEKAGDPFTGIALDVHMGHLLDPTIWKTATGFYGKQKGTVPNLGAMSYRAMIRKTAQELGWESGTQVQEAVWASIAGIKGNLQHFRGNIDDVLDNMHGESLATLWDHNVVIAKLMENPNFAKVMGDGGASSKTLKDMAEGKGVFASRKAKPGVADVDREAMRKAVDTIQQWTRHGSSSGAPGFMKRSIREMAQGAFDKLGLGNGFTRGEYDGLPIVSEIDASGKKLPKTQQGAGMRIQDYQPENVGAEGFVRGLSDTYRVAGDKQGKRPKMKLPKMEAVREAVGGAVKTVKDVWDRTGVKQAVGSAGTSRNQIPRVFNLVAKRFKKGSLNVDIGGGAWELSTQFLKKRGVRNLVYDPYNRTAAHNKKVINRVAGGRADTVTVANVLNVIKEKGARKRVLQQAADAVKPDGEIFISVHNAMREGGPQATRDGWQNSWPLKKYADEIEEVLEIVERTPDYIIAKKRTATRRGKALQAKVGNTVAGGRAVSVAFDESAAQTISTSGGGKVLSVLDAVTIKDASFDVGGKTPKVRGEYVDGKPSADGVEVTYDGKFFVTENGYAVRNAEEITLIDGKGYARGKVEYMTRESAVDEGLRESMAEMGGTKFLQQGADSPEGAKGATFMDTMGRIFIKGFTNADASTGFHELIHGWRLLHANRAISETDRISTGGLRDFEIDILEDALGVQKGAEWTTEQEEELALFFEKWVWEGEVFQTNAMSDRDFEILQVAMAKMSAAQRKVYEGVEHTLPEGAIPEPLRDLFSQAANRSDVQGTMDALGDEARAVYDNVLAGGVRSGKTRVQEELDRYETEVAEEYPGFKAGAGRGDEAYDALPHGVKTKLGIRRGAVNRQKEAASTAAEAVESRSTRKHQAKQELSDLYADLDAKYGDEGWTDIDLEPEDLAAVRAAREAVDAFDQEVPFASQAVEPEGPRTDREPESGFPEAERAEGGPINVRRGVGQFDDLSSGDDARDLLESRIREEEDWLREQKEFDKAEIQEREAKHYDDLRAAANRGGKEDISKFFDIATEQGRKFVAKSRAIRSFAADVFASAEDAAARLEVAREAGEVDRQAQADFLYYTGLFDPLVEQLNVMSHQMGFGLSGMKEEPWGTVLNRAVDDETIEGVLNATQMALTAARGGEETVDQYIDRLMVAMKEGQMSLVNASTTVNGDKLDTVLEVFYNSILSGPRTQSVNTLANTIYGTMLHLEKRIGRGMMSMGGSDEFPKTIGTVVGIREMLKDSFKLAKIAMREGSAQYDAMGGRATFDKAKGVYSGRTSRDYADRLGARNMPEPFKSLLNGALNFTAVGGYPVKLLGAMDEMFKQMHSRLVVHEELARKAAKLYPDDAAKMAQYIRSEFDTIIGEGNHFTKRRVKYDGLKEAYSKGLNKRDARRYAEEYYNRVYTDDRSALADRALDFSRRSTFTHPNAPEVGQNPISRQVQGIGNALSSATSQVRWLRFLAPFINTPTNLLSEATDHLASPLFDGAVPGYRKLKQIIGKGAGDPAFRGSPEEQAEALGRLAVSSSLISLVWMKANSGEITGGGPKDPKAQKLLREAGWQPYSVRFGDSYVGYGRLDPLASIVGIVADISEGMNGNPYTDITEDGAANALLMGTVMAVFRNISEKSYLSGVINFASALDNPEHYGKSFAHNLSGSVVPNALAQLNGQLDPTVRDVRGIVDKWKARLPGLSDDLVPKRNFLGEEEQRVQYLGGPLLGLLSPIPYSEVSHDQIKREVTKFGEVIGPPSNMKYGTLDLTDYKGADGTTAYDRYQELQGVVQRNGKGLKDSLLDLINSDAYNRLPDRAEDGSASPKMDLLKREVTRYRGTAWEQLLKEFPMLKSNYDITLYNRSARTSGRAERDLLSLIQ